MNMRYPRRPWAAIVRLAVTVTMAVLMSSGTIRVAFSQQAAVYLDKSNGSFQSAANAVVGWEFLLHEDVEVTHLGVYDWLGNGLIGTHQVGIWDVTATAAPLVDTTISAGMPSPLRDGFRYVPIAPVTLSAGSTYVIGSLASHVNDLVQVADSFGHVLYGRQVEIIQRRRLNSATTLEFPTTTSVYNGGYFGPNFLYQPDLTDIFTLDVELVLTPESQLALDFLLESAPVGANVLLSPIGKIGATIELHKTEGIKSIKLGGAELAVGDFEYTLDGGPAGTVGIEVSDWNGEVRLANNALAPGVLVHPDGTFGYASSDFSFTGGLVEWASTGILEVLFGSGNASLAGDFVTDYLSGAHIVATPTGNVNEYLLTLTLDVDAETDAFLNSPAGFMLGGQLVATALVLVPEPATWCLALLGGLLLAGRIAVRRYAS